MQRVGFQRLSHGIRLIQTHVTENKHRLARTVTSGLTPAALFPDVRWASVCAGKTETGKP
jgi:hypothetical protein